MKNHSESSFRKFRIHITDLSFCKSKYPSSIHNFGFELSSREKPDFLSSCQQCSLPLWVVWVVTPPWHPSHSHTDGWQIPPSAAAHGRTGDTLIVVQQWRRNDTIVAMPDSRLLIYINRSFCIKVGKNTSDRFAARSLAWLARFSFYSRYKFHPLLVLNIKRRFPRAETPFFFFLLFTMLPLPLYDLGGGWPLHGTSLESISGLCAGPRRPAHIVY